MQPQTIESKCVYTSGQNAVIDLTTLSRHIQEAMRRLIYSGERKAPVERVRMTPATKAILRHLFGVTGGHVNGRLYGVPIEFGKEMSNEIRFFGDSATPGLAGCYSSIFLDNNLYVLWDVDPFADTEKLPILNDD